MMTNKDFFNALEDLAAEKKIDKNYFIESLELALTAAYKKNFGEASCATVELNPEKHTIRVYKYKTVVATEEEVEDPDKSISLADARLIKKTVKVGEQLKEEVTPKNFGRISAQIARQVVMQRLREAEQNIAREELSEKENELITCIINRVELDSVYVDIPGTQSEGVLQKQDQIPGEHYEKGSRLKVYVKSLKGNAKASCVPVTRSTPSFVKRLFELEVPEIESGEVVIKGIVREAGNRTKMAVYSENKNLDPVGACVGNKGMRVAAIINELNGEKIDIIEWSENNLEYIARALSPAKIDTVYALETPNSARAVVADDKLSLAIGKAGQNVRLAVKLTGWNIDVKSETEARKIDGALFLNKEEEKFDIGDDIDDDILGDIE
jgi:N utilization substance protein A